MEFVTINYPEQGRRSRQVAALGLGMMLAVILFTVAPLEGYSQGDDDLTFQEIHKGIDRRSFSYSGPGLPIPGMIHAFRITPSEHKIRAVQAPRGSLSTIQELAKEHQLFFAINASFFDPQGRALGLIIDSGVTHQGLRKVDWGVFFVTDKGKAQIVHTRDYTARKDITVAVQSGPRLVVDGAPLKLKPQIAKRSAVCINARGQVTFIATERGILLQDFANLLARAEGNGGLGCTFALNLDGGSSTQGIFRSPRSGWHLIGGTQIPVALGFSVPSQDTSK